MITVRWSKMYGSNKAVVYYETPQNDPKYNPTFMPKAIG